jgi:hypothetical protein
MSYALSSSQATSGSLSPCPYQNPLSYQIVLPAAAPNSTTNEKPKHENIQYSLHPCPSQRLTLLPVYPIHAAADQRPHQVLF